MTVIKYECPITKYYIEYSIYDSTACFDFIDCDYVNFKAFLNLLRMSIDDLIKKNINKIQQCVEIIEYNELLKGRTSWKIVRKIEQTNSVVLECDISEFMNNYGIGLGVKN